MPPAKSTPTTAAAPPVPTVPRIRGLPLLAQRDYGPVRVFATTVLRAAQDKSLTGYLLELDWPTGRVIARIPIPIETSTPFWNPRGGNRGGRGVASHDGMLYVATASAILVFNPDLQQVGALTHPLLSGLHEIWPTADGIWITCTTHDIVLKLGYDGTPLDEWRGSESPVLQREFGFGGRELRPAMDFPADDYAAHYDRYCADERLHVNAVLEHRGRVFALASRIGALIQIRPTPERIIIRDPALTSPHNTSFTDDGRVLINDTHTQHVRVYGLADGRFIRAIPTRLPGGGADGASTQFTKPGWQRGLAHLRDSVYLAGVSPAAVFELDIDTGDIGQIHRIDDDPAHCIHGLCVARGLRYADIFAELTRVIEPVRQSERQSA